MFEKKKKTNQKKKYLTVLFDFAIINNEHDVFYFSISNTPATSHTRETK